MADQTKVAITRTVTLSDLTPQEVASIFCEFSNHQQAQFLDAIAAEAESWPGMGWNGQALSIAESDDLTERGARVGEQLAVWLREKAKDKGWIL
jgi:hypothetical protein